MRGQESPGSAARDSLFCSRAAAAAGTLLTHLELGSPGAPCGPSHTCTHSGGCWVTLPSKFQSWWEPGAWRVKAAGEAG